MEKRKDMVERGVSIPIGTASLNGDLAVPEGATALVLFAHGSGSSRFSPRNRYVAGQLQEVGLATLLMDLLTPQEEAIDRRTAQFRFSIDLLTDRLVAATDWLLRDPDTVRLQVGYFGASTGAGAALVAAAKRPSRVGAVVSRGGRPDLADRFLSKVLSPTLLIVGGLDYQVIRLNQSALAQIPAEKELVVIPGATHLFEEAGALEEVSHLASEWLVTYLVGREQPMRRTA